VEIAGGGGGKRAQITQPNSQNKNNNLVKSSEVKENQTSLVCNCYTEYPIICSCSENTMP
jgi:hypothetical protein